VHSAICVSLTATSGRRAYPGGIMDGLRLIGGTGGSVRSGWRLPDNRQPRAFRCPVHRPVRRWALPSEPLPSSWP